MQFRIKKHNLKRIKTIRFLEKNKLNNEQLFHMP